ncbi:uncharacterized protein KGF55_002130 [Candida pseudojiufengensis]|uniref:uncharacterized protein n=1 Tax=Candida pseudojiufengensis TaxID=497109 RepID=UPI00222589DA|nr:uncharacterized protein KGF55_002130 [Candida pseudojiufengensis]KAI5964188.1 hypothetical protein KGF55_002130 [Candida pseudojiufengensis]
MRGLSFNNFLNQVKKELTTAENSWLDAWFKIIKNKPTPLARNFLIEVDRNEMYDYICKSREKELENLWDMKDKEINSETFHHISRKTATTKPIIPNWISNEGLDYDEQTWKKFWTTLYSFQSSPLGILQQFHLFLLGFLHQEPYYSYGSHNPCNFCAQENADNCLHHLFSCDAFLTMWDTMGIQPRALTSIICNDKLKRQDYFRINKYITQVMSKVRRRRQISGLESINQNEDPEDH